MIEKSFKIANEATVVNIYPCDTLSFYGGQLWIYTSCLYIFLLG